MSYKDQVVLITGGAGGLGTELSRRYIDLGAIVEICDYSATNMESARQYITKAAGEHAERYCQMEVDVRSPNQIIDWVQNVKARRNRMDILINATGICPMKKIPEVTESIWDDVLDANLKSTFFASQAVAEMMKDSKYGRIINISSIAAYTGGAIASPAYSAAKCGIIALTKSFANYLSPFGVTVNAVAPGPFETEMIADYPKDVMERIVTSTPNRRVGLIEDIVHSILFLSDRNSLHITGATLDINGGLYLR